MRTLIAAMLLFCCTAQAQGFLTHTMVDNTYACPKAPGSWGHDGVTDAAWSNTFGQDVYIVGVVAAAEWGAGYGSYVNLFVYDAAGQPQWLAFTGERGFSSTLYPYFVWRAGTALRVQVWGNGISPSGACYAFVSVHYMLTPP